MAALKGNQYAKGNHGGRRPSEKEEQQHLLMWRNDTRVRDLEAKIASGVYSISDVYFLKALKADTVILKNLADKVLADLHDIRGKDGGAILIQGFNYVKPEEDVVS